MPTKTKTESLKTAFTEQFNIKYPIICAPMFLVSSVKMVVSTCEAGGLGAFPALNFRPVEKYLQAIKEIKMQTVKPFGINIIVQKSNKFQHKQLEYAIEEKVPLIITSLGSPREAIRLAHQVGTKVYCNVVGIEHAKKVADLRADGLITVGCGAGGHAGNISPFALIPYLVRNIDLPVVAAGNIVDGAGLAAALSLGAAAAYIGTRFIASEEAEVTADFKEAIIKAKCEDIVNTEKVDGFPGNFIRNEALKSIGLEKGVIEVMLSKSKRFKRWISLSRAAGSLLAGEKSKHSYKTVYSAGQGVGLIDRVMSIQEIMEKIMREYFEIKAQLP